MWSTSSVPAKPAWYGFATAIVDGLKSRRVKLQVETIVPIAAADFPTRAKRPCNSRLDLSRLKDEFGVTMPDWCNGLKPELDDLIAINGVRIPR